MLAKVRQARRLRGEIALPGDKSISHRVLLLNAVADGEAKVAGLSAGADVASTAACLQALGVTILPLPSRERDGVRGKSSSAAGGRVQGVGLRGLRQPSGPLDCGNSGTTMRLLAGLLAGQSLAATLIGDESLSRRPMDRVAEPLRLMGAQVSTGPLRVRGGELQGIEYRTPVASAQVKSALLLAGLLAQGETQVVEPSPTRDHTERMLGAMGAPIRVEGLAVSVRGPVPRLRPLNVVVPGDFSAAAFWLVAAGMHPDAALTLRGVGVNPARAGLLGLLRRVGIPVEARAVPEQGSEPVADLVVGGGGQRQPFEVCGQEAAGLIDELPVLAVAASLLPGVSRIRDAAELRIKESDRITTMSVGLKAMGADIEEQADGWEIRGRSQLKGARVASYGDHRVAMALAVAGLLAEGETEIEDADCVSVSYPEFWDHLELVSHGDAAER
jgi:3-phosphoshikimate 1-carboxyvinyltransferase